MASNFDVAFDVLSQHEGGFVDRAADRGGPTNFGLTLKDMPPDTTVFQLKTMDLAAAKAIYLSRWWQPLHFDSIASPVMGAVLFDQAVLSGPETAVTRLQSLLGVKRDGVLGPLTITAMGREEPKELAFKFLRASVNYYVGIVARNPEQVEFLSGWLGRLMSLVDFVFFGAL